jgi:hypothetical protein
MSSLPPRMSAEEKAMVRRMHFDQGLSPSEVAEATGRTLGTVCRTLQAKSMKKVLGRPVKLSEKKIDSIVKTMRTMIQQADGKKEITIAMVMTFGAQPSSQSLTAAIRCANACHCGCFCSVDISNLIRSYFVVVVSYFRFSSLR